MSVCWLQVLRWTRQMLTLVGLTTGSAAVVAFVYGVLPGTVPLIAAVSTSLVADMGYIVAVMLVRRKFAPS